MSKTCPYDRPTVFTQAPDLISPSELEKAAAERYADGAFAQGAYLKVGLDGVLKSLPVLKISAQDSFGLYTCPRKNGGSCPVVCLVRKLRRSLRVHSKFLVRKDMEVVAGNFQKERCRECIIAFEI